MCFPNPVFFYEKHILAFSVFLLVFPHFLGSLKTNKCTQHLWLYSNTFQIQGISVFFFFRNPFSNLANSLKPLDALRQCKDT